MSALRGEGHMFGSWLKIADKCEACGLDYRFAAPDDGPAFFSLCIIAFPLTFLVLWIQVALEPPFWVHLTTSVPIMLAGCLLPLRPIRRLAGRVAICEQGAGSGNGQALGAIALAATRIRQKATSTTGPGSADL